MFEEYQQLLSDLESNVKETMKFLDISEDKIGLLEAIREVVGEALLIAANQAIEKTPEFQYPPLKERLLDNLSNLDKHVIISNRTLKVFDEEYAGTSEDLISGQESAGGHTGTPQAPAVWRYGIYLPFFGQGGGLSERLKLPDYGTIINERLSAWGDKAPYWYFLEYGNVGMSRAYPTFGGTSFIASIRAKIPEIISKAIEIFAARAIFDVNELVNEYINVNPKSRTRVTVYRYTVAGAKVSLQKTSAGKFFYRIGNQTYSVDQFKSVIRVLLQ